MNDPLTEMIVGKEGAIRLVGKFYIMPTATTHAGGKAVLMAGVVVLPPGESIVLPENEQYSEMWETEIILIPKRKYSSFPKGKKPKDFFPPFAGWRVDQVLAGKFGDPKSWEREYFESKD
jgi:hypothetical protein